MRRVITLAFALLLSLHAALGFARERPSCCDQGCADLAMCISAACKGCPPCALTAAPIALPPMPEDTTMATAVASPHTITRADIWRPPR